MGSRNRSVDFRTDSLTKKTNRPFEIMRTNSLPAVGLFLGLIVLCPVAATAFDSGSDGSYGPMSITTNTTLDLPPDGIFKCTTINVASGAALRFNPNPLNTPVYLLATGDVVIAGTLDVSGGRNNGWMPGKGGPGGFDGGYGGIGIDHLGGDGQGPGGAPGGAFYVSGGVFAGAYGNSLLVPLIGGSGGGGCNGGNGFGGGGGGGAVLIAANTNILITGSVVANGGSGYWSGGNVSSGFGSGGGIRIVSPNITGNGSLSAAGPGQGRIRLDCTNQYSFRFLTMNGAATRGSQLFVFPPFTNRLDIIQAAGITIPEGTNAVIQIELPVGASTNQTVTVQARGFTNDVPITVAVVPENRPSTKYNAVIVMANNPSALTLNVVIPDGTISRIQAWTR